MTTIDLFLREHAAVHAHEVARPPFTMAHLLDGLTDAQWRERPHGLNSIAWITWHMARVEDSCLAPVVLGAEPEWDLPWIGRVDVEPDCRYILKGEVQSLSNRVDLKELRRYRNAVGRHTREFVQAFPEERWQEELTEDDLRRGVTAGMLDGDETHLLGRTRHELLCWWGLAHAQHHLGQVAMLRGMLKA